MQTMFSVITLSDNCFVVTLPYPSSVIDRGVVCFLLMPTQLNLESLIPD